MMTGLRNAALVAMTLVISAAPVWADFAKVTDRSEFVALVNGKTLSRPLVSLSVSPSGGISGNGAGWDVNGEWSWKDGYFCRDLYWGGDALGYNCQEVRSDGTKIRFTSDQGAGDSAEFRLR
ncbi:dihydrodipicolinate reductase [Thalassococcus sp. BH17M4-6]|uniref:dihydrodipicolinate reductase n=1 Tax=Thalassococcus sp. BH17M4-6 TaxID=3413148 RepID=UPI003BD09D9E